MEHIMVTPLPDGFDRLTAADGYKLYSLALRRVVSEAVVEPAHIVKFTAIPA